MKPSLHLLLLTGLLTLSQPGTAADTTNGKSLHQQNCVACHDDGVYTRNDRRVKNLASLETQVKRCELSQGLKWFDEDVDDVTGYLNETYYKF